MNTEIIESDERKLAKEFEEIREAENKEAENKEAEDKVAKML